MFRHHIIHIPATYFDCKESLLGSLLDYVNECTGIVSAEVSYTQVRNTQTLKHLHIV